MSNEQISKKVKPEKKKKKRRELEARFALKNKAKYEEGILSFNAAVFKHMKKDR